VLDRDELCLPVLVILLNDNAVFGYVGERDVLVGDARDGAGSAGYGLDAHAVVGVLDGGGEDVDGLDDIVGAAPDGAWKLG